MNIMTGDSSNEIAFRSVLVENTSNEEDIK